MIRERSGTVATAMLVAALATVSAGCGPGAANNAEGVEAASAATWTTRAAMPEERTEVSATTDGRRIYVAGGVAEPTAALAPGERAGAPRRLWVYDPGEDKWSSPTALPRGVNHTGFVYLDGRLYVIGGFREGQFTTTTGDVWIYDLATGEWRAGRPMPTPRGAAALGLVDGKIHWIGGNGMEGHIHDGMFTRDWSVGIHEVYDPVADRWERRASMPSPRNHPGAGVVNGRIHVIGGRFNDNSQMTLHEIYDPKTNRWETGPPMPTGRSGVATVARNGWIYVFGGEKNMPPWRRTFREAERFDTRTGRWESLPPLATPRHGLAAAVLSDGIHVISGGPRPALSYSGIHDLLSFGVGAGT